MARDLFAQPTGGRNLFAQQEPSPGPVDALAQPEQDSFFDNTLDVLGEGAAAANRAVTGTADLPIDLVNTILRQAGAEYQLPTITGSLEGTGIQGGFMEDGTAKEVVQAAGSTIPAAAALAQVPRNLATAGGAAAEFLGFGSAKSAPIVAATGVEPPRMPGGPKTELKRDLLNQNPADATAGVRLDPGAPVDAQRVVSDPVAQNVLKQGIDPGFTAWMKTATPEAKRNIAKMIEISQNRKTQGIPYRQAHRALDVPGESILNRVQYVDNVNKQAGQEVNRAAHALQGSGADLSEPVGSLMETMSEMGVKMKDGELIFTDSRFAASPDSQQTINAVFKAAGDVLANPQVDANRAHVVKLMLDDVLDIGSQASGGSTISKQAKRALKKFRADISDTLNTQFPEYGAANAKFSDTATALDNIKSIAGKRMDFFGPNADRALGILSRRTDSNAVSGVPLTDAINSLTDTASRYGMTGVNDEVLNQVQFASILEGMLGDDAGFSIGGIVGKAVDRGVDAATGNKAGVVGDLLKGGIDKARGINEDNALLAMMDLLNQ